MVAGFFRVDKMATNARINIEIIIRGFVVFVKIHG